MKPLQCTTIVPYVIVLCLLAACQGGTYTAAGPVIPVQKLKVGMSLDETSALLSQVPVKKLRTILDSGKIFEVYEYQAPMTHGDKPSPAWLSFANDKLVHWGTRNMFEVFVEQFHLDIPMP